MLMPPRWIAPLRHNPKQAISICLCIGMSIVFIFLGILVFVTKMMSKVTLDLFPEHQVNSLTSTSQKSHSKSVDSDVIAAISAAVHLHRSKNKVK